MSDETKGPQPPVEAQPVAVVQMDSIGCKYLRWSGGYGIGKELPPTGTKLYTAPPSAPVGVDAVRYDAGLLSDYGGGNVEWWQDYIRSELERAHDFYTEALAQQPAAVDFVGIANRAQEALGRGVMPSTVKAVLEAAGQQPASDGGFSAADMMDARQEGRKEARLPAFVRCGDGTHRAFEEECDG